MLLYHVGVEDKINHVAECFNFVDLLHYVVAGYYLNCVIWRYTCTMMMAYPVATIDVIPRKFPELYLCTMSCSLYIILCIADRIPVILLQIWN